MGGWCSEGGGRGGEGGGFEITRLVTIVLRELPDLRLDATTEDSCPHQLHILPLNLLLFNARR